MDIIFPKINIKINRKKLRYSQGGGGISWSKKKKSLNTINPFFVHTLTGTKKNIEKSRKSMNKAKKILGNNKTRKNHLSQRRPQ